MTSCDPAIGAADREPLPASRAGEAVNRLTRRASTALARSMRPRTGQRVHRNSRHRGERERGWWRPVDPLEVRAIVEAAKLEELATKEAGKRNGRYGRCGIIVLEFLAGRVEWATGALEDSYRYIAARTRLSYDAVWRALKRLKVGGLIDWLRRTQPVEDDGTGRTVEQIENAYRFEIPERWRERVRARIAQWRARAARAGQRWRDGKDDEAARADRREAERQRRYRAFVEATVEDPIRRAELLAAPPGASGESA